MKVKFSKNELLKLTISDIKYSKDKMTENYQIKRIIVEAIQGHPKLLEKDYKDDIRKGDTKIQTLKRSNIICILKYLVRTKLEGLKNQNFKARV